MKNVQINDVNGVNNGKKLKRALPFIITALILIIAVIIIFVSSSKSVNIEDYITDSIKFSGYNGYGQIEAGQDIIDYDRLITDLEMQSTDFSEMLGAEIVLESCISLNISTGEAPKNLSNSDKVEYIITVDYDKINGSGFKKKLKGKDKITKSYEVLGLTEIIEINPFDAIEKVIVSESYGTKIVNLQIADKINNYDIITESYARLSYNFKTENGTIYVNFNVPEIANINAGDKIKISLQEDAEKYINKGIKFTACEQEFSVVTADVLNSASKVTGASYNVLKDKFNSYTKNENGDEYAFCDLYFLSQTGNYTKSVSNQIIAIYKFKSGAVGSTEEYIYLYAENPLISSDGEIVKGTVNVQLSDMNFDLFSENVKFTSAAELEKKLAASENGVTVTAFEKITF